MALLQPAHICWIIIRISCIFSVAQHVIWSLVGAIDVDHRDRHLLHTQRGIHGQEGRSIRVGKLCIFAQGCSALPLYALRKRGKWGKKC